MTKLRRRLNLRRRLSHYRARIGFKLNELIPTFVLARHFDPGSQFVMLHMGRCGSTVLANMLNQHSAILDLGEICHAPYHLLDSNAAEDRKKIRRNRWLSSRHFSERDWIGYIETRTLRGKKNVMIRGHEMKFFHLALSNIPLSEYLSGMRALGCRRFVVLRRENYLRYTASVMVAEQRNQYSSHTPNVPLPSKVSIDLMNVEMDSQAKPLTDFFEGYDKTFAEIERLLTPEDAQESLYLTYEKDVLEDPYLAYRKVCRFLGAEAEQPAIKLHKTTPYALHDVFENYVEIVRALRGTKYEWMLEQQRRG